MQGYANYKGMQLSDRYVIFIYRYLLEWATSTLFNRFDAQEISKNDFRACT